MKNLPNIEKSIFNPKNYIGYDSFGYGWRIEKSNSSYGNWCATSTHSPNRHIFAWRLSDLSTKLKEFQA